MDYELGKKAAAREILDYIEYICFSRDDEIIKFRANRGSNGVRDNIIEFIRSKYLNSLEAMEGEYEICSCNPQSKGSTLYELAVRTAMTKMGATDADFSLLTEETIQNNIAAHRNPEDLAWAITQ